jgi:flagellar assembly protein FliH
VAWRQVLNGKVQPNAAGRAAAGGADMAAQAAEMRQQMEQRVRDAHAAGVKEGEAMGRTKAAAEMQPVIERFTRTIDELAKHRASLRREAEADTIKLALAIARRILRREIAVDSEALHGLVLGALEKLQSQELSRVRVHPSHVGAVTAQIRAWGNTGNVEVIGDASRQPGTAIFETQRGNLDASVESQLKEIERGLADCLRRQS